MGWAMLLVAATLAALVFAVCRAYPIPVPDERRPVPVRAGTRAGGRVQVRSHRRDR